MHEPYDPRRIPVVLVHGLLSHPRMWRDVLNELRADPALRGRFQFWSFRYPTGWPILYSAMHLRTELTSIYKTLDPQPPPMILVGHSMGGLISHLQVIPSGPSGMPNWSGTLSAKCGHCLPAISARP